MKMPILFFLLTILSNCIATNNQPNDPIDIVPAVEIVCPGAPKTLLLRVSPDELREALRRQFTHDNTVETVLKLPDGSNIIIPGVRPQNMNQCFVRELPEIVIPNSTGY